MPKQKTHSGISKRVRITGSGKLVRQQAGRRHKFERKPTSLTRRLDGLVLVDGADAVKVRRLLGK
jgi:large subunit ribosomal protein L35